MDTIKMNDFLLFVSKKKQVQHGFKWLAFMAIRISDTPEVAGK